MTNLTRALIFAILLVMTITPRARSADLLVYFGNELDKPDTGIFLSHFDTDTGTLTPPVLNVQASKPGYFVIDPTGRFMYAANALGKFNGDSSGAMSAYSIDRATGQLTLINQVPTGGANPAFIALDNDATHVLAANYTGGSICVYSIRPDGGIADRTAFVQHSGHSINPQRQTQPHPHSIYTDPTDRFVLVPDLGQDKVFVYRFDHATGALTPNDPPYGSVASGAGPRHLAFHPNGRWVYVLDEMGGSVTRFNWNSDTGAMTDPQATITTPADYKGLNTSGEVRIDSAGKFLYATNRGPDDIAVFSIDPQTGDLTFVQRVPTKGKMPRYFIIDPTGKWLMQCNHDGYNVVIFRIDPQTGMLTQNGDPVTVPNPYCAQFLSMK
jgi:6-phosphogluconolactonase